MFTTGVVEGSGRLIRLMIDDELRLLSDAVLLVVALAWRLLKFTLLKFLLLALALLRVRLLALTLLRLRLLAMIFFLARGPALATEELMELTLAFLICNISQSVTEQHCHLTDSLSAPQTLVSLNVR